MNDKEFLQDVWLPNLLGWDKDGQRVTVWVPEYEIPYFHQGISGAAKETRDRIQDLDNLREEIKILEEKTDPLYDSTRKEYKPFQRIIERLKCIFVAKAEGLKGYDPEFERKKKYTEQPNDRD